MAGCKVVKASMDQSVTNLLNCSTQYEEGAVKKSATKPVDFLDMEAHGL